MCSLSFLFFFNDTATTEIYTLSLHDALPIYPPGGGAPPGQRRAGAHRPRSARRAGARHLRHQCAGLGCTRSEEHTSELQSQSNLVCRLLLEKKKTKMREK